MPIFAAFLVGAGLFVIVLGVGASMRARRETMDALLEAELAEPGAQPEMLSDLMEKAGHFAERMIGRTSMAGRVQLMLSRAGWSLRPGEFLSVLASSAVVVGAFAAMLSGSLAVAMVIGLAWMVGVYSMVGRAAARRTRQIEEQLPSVLQLLAGSLESGSSVQHSLELVVEDGDPPLATELERVLAETRVGRPLIESLEALAARIGSHDLDWTVEAIRIQQQTGGKLAETLRVLADFMRARLEVRGEVRALSAEARISAKVLTGLPISIGTFFFLFRRSYFEPLYTTGVGKYMLAFGALGIIVGSLWMRRLVRVEV